MTALDELARELGTSGRTLRRAADRGLIRVRRPTPNKIELDYAEREYVRARWATISALLDALRTEPNVLAAALYGSFARGTEIAGSSDIDLLVSLRADTPAAAWDLEQRLAERVGRTIDVQRLSQAERDPEFLLAALDDARPLVDRDEAWRRVTRNVTRLRRAAACRADDRRRRIARNLERLGS